MLIFSFRDTVPRPWEAETPHCHCSSDLELTGRLLFFSLYSPFTEFIMPLYIYKVYTVRFKCEVNGESGLAFFGRESWEVG